MGDHVKEIFSNFGHVKHVEIAIDKTVNLPRGFAYVEYESREDAEKALDYMDGGQIDGSEIRLVSWGADGIMFSVFCCCWSCAVATLMPFMDCENFDPWESLI